MKSDKNYRVRIIFEYQNARHSLTTQRKAEYPGEALESVVDTTLPDAAELVGFDVSPYGEVDI